MFMKKETTKKKTTKKVTQKNKKTVKRAFTLIELLAVIIILGVLMIIAIPSVTSYISESRKSSYISTVKNTINSMRTKVNEGLLSMYDTDTTYYIPINYVETENDLKTPFGDFTQAYIGVIYDGQGFKYYWVGTDSSGHGIKKVTAYDDLKTELIETDLKDTEIRDIVEKTSIGERRKIIILGEDNVWGEILTAVSFVGEDGSAIIVYPAGKSKSTVAIGDIVTIGSEQFYVINYNETTNDLTLLARYNLKVGDVYSRNIQKIKTYSSSDPGYGMQSSEVRGSISGEQYYYGVTVFVDSPYWQNQVGSGKKYPGSYSNPYFPYVYDSNSKLYQYVEYYAQKLEVTIKEARLLKFQEAIALGCSYSARNCTNAPAFLRETTFWTGSAWSDTSLWYVSNGNYFDPRTHANYVAYGVRPVIVI